MFCVWECKCSSPHSGLEKKKKGLIFASNVSLIQVWPFLLMNPNLTHILKRIFSEKSPKTRYKPKRHQYLIKTIVVTRAFFFFSSEWGYACSFYFKKSQNPFFPFSFFSHLLLQSWKRRNLRASPPLQWQILQHFPSARGVGKKLLLS